METQIINNWNNYSISNTGIVTNIKTEKELKAIIRSNGYLQVNLSINGNRKSVMIHQLVAEAFLDKPLDYGINKVINHIDGNKQNNNWLNLEYITQKENIKHAINTGLMDFNGENSCNSKLTNIEANKIRNIYLSEKISLMNLAKRYNVSERTIGRIIHNETYK